MKYAWIDSHRRHYPLSALCGVLSVSLNGYRAWKRGGTPGRKRLTDAQLLALIRSIHAEVKGAYGSPRMTEDDVRDLAVGQFEQWHRVARHQLRAGQKGLRVGVSTQSVVACPAAAANTKGTAHARRRGDGRGRANR
ncbi:hypothetical protein QFZ94_008894 [Paraburkholderia sp. JPY465]